MRHLVYAFIDENKKIFYIGKTNNLKNRTRSHLYEVKNGNHLPKYNKLRKIMKKGYKIQELITVLEDNISYKDIDEREIFHISKC